jgi:ABC-type dipeptide/oligopeptide/nickel transport system permease subunit
MLSEATHWFQIAPNFMLFPGLAIFLTVLAFNLFGDGLRDALDPRSRYAPAWKTRGGNKT